MRLARWLLAATATASASLGAASGCSLPLADATASLSNHCETRSDCAGDAACVSLTSGRACVATSVDLPGLLLEIRPSASAVLAADTSYLVDPSSPGRNQFAQDPFSLQGEDAAGIVAPFDVSLPKLVTIAKGLVQAHPKDATATCALSGGSIFADVELQRAPAFVGLPAVHYTATTEVRSDDAGPVSAFKLAVPPDVYNVYVTPKPLPTAGTGDGCALPPLPPAYFPSQTIAEDADLNIALPAEKKLTGTLQVPQGASVKGWVVELVEPYTGRRISTTATLAQDALKFTVSFELSYYWTFKDAPIIRLKPPDGLIGPTVHWDLASADIDGDGNVALTLSDLDATPKHIEAQVLDARGAPVPASIELQSTSLSGLANASYRVTTQTGPDGTFSADLLLGSYRVVARPTIEEQKAIAVAAWTIGSEDLCCGRTLVLDDRALLAGSAVTPSGEGARGASVVASPSLPSPSKYLATALGLAPILPRESSAFVAPSGEFTLGVDPGQFDLSVRPPDASLFAWIVRSRVTVAAERELPSDLGTLVDAYPAILTGTIRDGLDAVVAGAVVRAWLPVAAPGDGSALAGTVIQIAETKTDDAGRYELPLPTSIAE